MLLIVVTVSVLAFDGAWGEFSSVIAEAKTKVAMLDGLLNRRVQACEGDLCPPYHIYESCTPLLKTFSKAATAFTNCAVNFSLPPSVCIGCGQSYLDLISVYNSLQNSTTPVFGGHSCRDAIFSDYAVSFVREIYTSLVGKIWDAGSCQYCVILSEVDGERKWNFTQHTVQYQKLLRTFRNCLNKYHSKLNNSSKKICENCWETYRDVYNYYWDVFIRPEVDFCLDIQATMNDTIQLWRSYYGCIKPETVSRASQAFLVTFLSVIVCVVTIIFYAGSFIQGERQARKLKKYSRFNSPMVNHDLVEERPSSSRPMGYGAAN